MKIIFLAQFPPPIHGLSKAIDTLYHSCLSDKYHFEKINITSNKRIIQTLFAILTKNTDVFYFTISQTKGGNWRDILFLALIALKRRKCIVHLHGGYYRQLMQEDCAPVQKWINRKLMSRVQIGIVLGDSLRNMFERYIPQERIRVVPNCIDDEFLPVEITEKLELMRKQNEIHVVYLSNFIKEKGYWEVLEIAKKMKEKNREKDFVFHFAGKFFDRSQQEYFENYIKQEKLSNIRFHGVVMADEKKNLLKMGHMMILLTHYPNEGQPISLLEGMGNGMAVVTTNHSGIPDIVTESNGFVCDKHHIEVDDIVAYLEKCWKDREYLCGTCENNYQWVKDNFTQKKYIVNMDKVFEEVCYGQND